MNKPLEMLLFFLFYMITNYTHASTAYIQHTAVNVSINLVVID